MSTTMTSLTDEICLNCGKKYSEHYYSSKWCTPVTDLDMAKFIQQLQNLRPVRRIKL